MRSKRAILLGHPVKPRSVPSQFHRSLPNKSFSDIFSREELELQQTFEEIWPKVFDFIQSQPKPVCVLAHNGFQHDFPILANQLFASKIDECFLPPDEVGIQWRKSASLDLLCRYTNVSTLLGDSASARSKRFSEQRSQKCFGF